MKGYHPTIGLEVHAELKTATKMFCTSLNDPNEREPNRNICPVCMAHPGTLPVINKEAVRQVLRVGSALKGSLATFSEFDRKNYFYPDLPKGYQISQYAYPLVSGGSLADVALTRIHLEEDTARSSHTREKYSLIDFNRAGVPLMELVTEPVIESAEHAVRFAKELRLLLRTLGSSDANMEKGQMRVEANISVSKEKGVLGTKVEVKNLNSFRSVERAILHEIERQGGLLERGESVVQETRGWNENTQETFSQRMKEESHDYRYFPEPDLPKLNIESVPEFSKETLEESLPELPWTKRERYKNDYSLSDEDSETYLADREAETFFADVMETLKGKKELARRASNYITSDLLGLSEESGKGVFQNLSAQEFATLMYLLEENSISSRGAKNILKIMVAEGGEARAIAEREGLLQTSDEESLKEVIKTVIDEHTEVVVEYKNGKESALQFLVGQGMKATKGAGNPQVLSKLFKEHMERE